MSIERLALLRTELSRQGLDGLVVTGPANRYYLSGFTGSNGALAITHNAQFIFTDFRYLEQVAQEAPAFTLQQCAAVGLLPEVAKWLAECGLHRIGIEGDHLNVVGFRELTQVIPQDRLVIQTGLVEGIRARKMPEEIDRISRAAAINDRAWVRLIPSIRPGASENDLAAELEYLLRREGADGMAFGTIAASGPRGALPHGAPSAKKIIAGELVVFDFGARLNGYASDITRTVAVGSLDEKGREIYRVVADAQALALEAIRPGLTGREVDAVARRHIQDAGYGDNFGHGLGHSVGIEVHEEPRLSRTGEQALAPGMVVTVEPGIYLPGYGGVRIEDLVVVTETGYRNLTGSPKDLTII